MNNETKLLYCYLLRNITANGGAWNIAVKQFIQLYRVHPSHWMYLLDNNLITDKGTSMEEYILCLGSGHGQY